VVAQQFGDRQHKVGGGCAGWECTGQLQAHHDGHRQRQGLAEHDGLCLDAADAEPDHPDAVDHRGVGVGADQGVRERDQLTVDLACVDDWRQVLEVDLVHDAHAGRDDAEIVERLLRPTQQRVALAVALILDGHVVRKRLVVAEVVDLDRVVDDHIGRDERVDAGGVTAHLGHRVTHRGKVDDARHAGEVLQHDTARNERDLDGLTGVRRPRNQGPDIVVVDEAADEVPQHVFKQDLDRDGMPCEIGAEGVEAVDGVPRVTNGQRVAGDKRVGNRGQRRCSSGSDRSDLRL